jgi:hypothetical protein
MILRVIHLTLLLALIGAGGCHSATGKTVPAALAGNDPGAQIEFWHSLNDQTVASNDEVFHGILLFTDGKDDSKDYAGRVATLKARKMLPWGFDEPAERAVSRGTTAVAIVQMLKIRGGLTMSLLGPIPRYSVRELIFMNLFPPGSAQQTFTGAEFVGIIGRVEDYQRGGSEDVPATVLTKGLEQ